MRIRTIKTSAEVWAVIMARHRNELTVFSTLSKPDGDPMGDPEAAVMRTEYGFKSADHPLMGAKTTWRVGDREKTEETKYWLCVLLEDVK
mgnify:CR=1 FL=1